LNKVSLCQNNSERCELVKLCHDINRNGPVFLRHSVYYSKLLKLDAGM